MFRDLPFCYYKNSIDYFAIATLGNATDFGNAVAHSNGKSGVTNVTRGVMPSGDTTNSIEYITCATIGNATDFGDDTIGTGGKPITVGNGTRGIFCGRGDTHNNTIDYVTVASTGNATDFGDLTYLRGDGGRGEDSTRAVMMGGNNSNVIDYITMG